MRTEFNILLHNFDEEEVLKIRETLSQTSLKASEIYLSQNIEDVRKSTDWDCVNFIIVRGNPEIELSSPQLKDLIDKMPILFIDYSNSARVFFPKKSEFFDYIPFDQLNGFILERCMLAIYDKINVQSKQYELDALKNDSSINEDKYKELFENSSIGIYEVDPDGNFILANKVFLKILGLEKYSELKNINVFKPGFSTNGSREKLKHLLTEHSNVDNFEDEWLKADSTKIFVKENIWVKKDSTGSVKYYQGVVEDITNRKFVEAELVQSKKDAEKSDKLKSEFLTQISHEIRTPVNTLLSFVALIEQELHESLSDELIGCFEHLNNAGQRITRTIDLLVKMSELHTDNYDPDFKENDLFTLLEDVIKAYHPIASEKNIQLEFIKGVDSANIVFDYVTIQDVFSNIIDNAIKFTPNGAVKVYIKKSLMNKISVTVIDSGIGISQKYLNNLFKPFSQETSGYTRKFDGNGLGLALVKEYCNLNNAEIFVSSEKNIGSNFTIVFK